MLESSERSDPGKEDSEEVNDAKTAPEAPEPKDQRLLTDLYQINISGFKRFNF